MFLLFGLLFLLANASDQNPINLTLYSEEDYSPAQTRILASAEKQKIRIAAFYFLDNAPVEIRKLLKEQVIPGAIAYYQATLKAIPSPEPLSWTKDQIEKCADIEDMDIPQALKDGVNADLVLLFTGDKLPDETYSATASNCDLEKGFKRPNFGRIRYNYMYVGASDGKYLDRISLTYLTLHEMGHILGFSKGLFDKYYNPETGQSFDPVKEKEVNGQTITLLALEPLNTKLRKYFDCPSLEGAYLENQGKDGSVGTHFERRIFMNDVLTASTLSDARVSEFFLTVLEGSGWYSVDYDMKEPFTWGKGKGCDFLNKPCLRDKKTAFPDSFCMPLESFGCNFDQSGYGVCGNWQEEKNEDLPSAFNYYGKNIIVSDGYADNCPYNYLDTRYKCQDSTNVPVFLYEEYFGSGSSCFSGNLYDNLKEVPYCFKRTCLEVASNKYQVIVEIGDTNVVCAKKGSISVPGYSGKLNCPDPTSYCRLTEVKYCPRGCMGRGKCTSNKKCQCYDGYSGSDCGTRATSTMKEGTLDYLENFPGFTRISSENKSKIKISLRVMSVIIGVGIIGITVVVGLTVNKIRDLHLTLTWTGVLRSEFFNCFSQI